MLRRFAVFRVFSVRAQAIIERASLSRRITRAIEEPINPIPIRATRSNTGIHLFHEVRDRVRDRTNFVFNSYSDANTLGNTCTASPSWNNTAGSNEIHCFIRGVRPAPGNSTSKKFPTLGTVLSPIPSSWLTAMEAIQHCDREIGS